MRKFILLLSMAGLAIAEGNNLPFFEDFNNSIPAAWTAVKEQGNNAITGNWLWTEGGPEGQFAIDPLQSTSAENGWVMFDSFGNCSLSAQDVWLVSPRMSAAGLNSVFLKFETFYRTFNDRATVEVSTDSTNWISVEIFPNLAANDYGGGSKEENPQTVVLNLSDYAANQAQFWFAFRFLSDGSTNNGGNVIGCGYAWQIDDVSLTEEDPRPANDLKISNAFFAIPPNAATPSSQVESFSFLADIENIGSTNQEGVSLTIAIENLDGTSPIFTDRIDIGAIAVDERISDIVDFTPFSPAPQKGNYKGRYELHADRIDANFEDNVRQFEFSITDTLFAKSFSPTTEIAPTVEKSYAYGNCFYFPNGLGYYGRYVIFQLNNYKALQGKSINILTYRWEGDLNEDLFANPSEYGNAPIAINTYTFTGEEQGLLSLPISDSDTGIPLERDMYYFTVLQYVADDETTMLFAASSDQNYLGMYLASLASNSARYASLLDIGNTGTYDMVGFGFDIVPTLHLSVSRDADLAVNTTLSSIPSNSIQVFPNPARQFATIEFNLRKSTDLQVQLLNVHGRLITQYELTTVQKEQFNIPVEHLEQGAYLLDFISPDFTYSLRLQVQK